MCSHLLQAMLAPVMVWPQRRSEARLEALFSTVTAFGNFDFDVFNEVSRLPRDTKIFVSSSIMLALVKLRVVYPCSLTSLILASARHNYL